MKKNIIYFVLVFIFLTFFVLLYNGLEKVNVYIPEKVINKNIIDFSGKELYSNKIKTGFSLYKQNLSKKNDSK